MRIEIELESHDPPVGVVVRPDGVRLAFAGWLGLLRVLSEQLETPAPPRGPGTPRA